MVGLSSQDLRSHVAGSTDLGRVGAASITALKGASEAEIDDFDIEVFVEKDVLGFEVAVRKALGVDVVNSLQHLLEEVLADGFGEGT